MSLKALCTSIAIVALLPASVRAEQVALDFTATVWLDTAGYAPVGSVISGHYVFDRDPASFTSQPVDPRYLQGESGTDYFYTARTGDTRLQFPSGSPDVSKGFRAIEVIDNTTWTGPTTDSVSFLQKTLGVSYYLDLRGPDTSFSGTALPTNSWLSGGWTQGYFSIQDPFHTSTVLSAQVTSLSVSLVPEPATAALMLVGLAGLGFARRRA
ncbi:MULTISPECIES: PEP-CTERM sorting domain-containing protein [unclassified Rhizobacter]|uniref:PEP-CTERM sorting domain-containing protein n=1 Tax=unclassified Rhizobacter TaxID=2640088 RepID=UPI0006F3EA41|nr:MULTISPECIES: PEP-CTERM sorting domain-containing protein [unclassified Rhizobacter]KQU74986.1 hypothetical protein ASC88_26605 [Rhizobacter sp. Root29]KQW00939.1 hypothetical protein ASC98_06360 [Rhizobacter sp. Root1238]KRB03789.1 hypothetical protein ASE08_13865 [Rhizobacter sp. Root16D2]